MYTNMYIEHTQVQWNPLNTKLKNKQTRKQGSPKGGYIEGYIVDILYSFM